MIGGCRIHQGSRALHQTRPENFPTNIFVLKLGGVIMFKTERSVPIFIAALAMLTTSIAFANNFEKGGDEPQPLPGSVPKANGGRGDHTESGLQGQTTPKERFSGDSERAYNCNLNLVSQFKGEGSVSQNGPAFFGDCAYYATNDNPQQQHLGVAVIDVSNPLRPVAADYLADTPSMLNPHETLRAHTGRGLLAGAEN